MRHPTPTASTFASADVVPSPSDGRRESDVRVAPHRSRTLVVPCGAFPLHEAFERDGFHDRAIDSIDIPHPVWDPFSYAEAQVRYDERPDVLAPTEQCRHHITLPQRVAVDPYRALCGMTLRHLESPYILSLSLSLSLSLGASV